MTLPLSILKSLLISKHFENDKNVFHLLLDKCSTVNSIIYEYLSLLKYLSLGSHFTNGVLGYFSRHITVG